MSVTNAQLISHQTKHGDILGACPTSTASTTATAALTYRETNFTSCASGTSKGRAINISKNGRISVTEVSCQ